MTSNKDDELISALIDDELDAESREKVLASLSADSGKSARFEGFSAIDQLLRDTYREVHDVPLPRIDAEAIIARRSVWQRHVSVPLAVAASVIMLLGGVLSGMIGERITGNPGARQIVENAGSDHDLSIASPELNRELEARASGERAGLRLAGGAVQTSFVITRTWRLDDGRYCREYEIGGGVKTPDEIGIACRENTGQWRIRIRTFPDQTGKML